MISSLVVPSATIARTVATGNRRPRIHGTPAILDGSEVILAKAIWPGYPDAVAWIPTSHASLWSPRHRFGGVRWMVYSAHPFRRSRWIGRPGASRFSADETLIGYARCSTDEQDLTAQRQALHALGVPPDRVYIDHGISGTKRGCHSRSAVRSTTPPNEPIENPVSLRRLGQLQGLMTSSSSKRWKSLRSRVTTVMSWTKAVAPMRASRNGAGSGTCKPASATCNTLVHRQHSILECCGDALVEPCTQHGSLRRI